MSEKNYLSLDSSILYRCNQKYFDKLLAEYDLGYTQFIFLTQIYENEGISMNELAYLGVFDKGTITKAIQKLEQLDYVRIESGLSDKRTKLLYTSDKARSIMPDLYKKRLDWNEYLSADLSLEQKDAYYGTLAKLIDKAREYNKLELAKETADIRFYGLQKITLLDFPGQMAATLFTGGCNFRCPFCHNRSLVFLNENNSQISVDDILDYLRKRANVLDGVCITGGEPLLHSGLRDFIVEVRQLGYKIKLDSNGLKFAELKALIDEGIVDYVAMDIKNCADKYGETAGLDNLDFTSVKKSIDYLLENHVDYEFRTTVVKQFHTVEDIEKIGKDLIKGAKAYYLQNFEDHGNCIVEGLSAVDEQTLKDMKKAVEPYVGKVQIRGIEE